MFPTWVQHMFIYDDSTLEGRYIYILFMCIDTHTDTHLLLLNINACACLKLCKMATFKIH